MDRFSEEGPGEMSRNLRTYRDDLDDYHEQFCELCPRPTQIHCTRCGMTKREVQFEAAVFTAQKVPACCEGAPEERRVA